MFVLSQYLLNSSGMCNPQQITSYSIALGLILYSSIYLYILFYNNEYLSVFNKFIIYIVVVDLLLSAFYYFNSQDKEEPPSLILNNDTSEDDDDEDDEEDDEDEEDNEYTSESDEEQELDEESQRYIDNLIAQARISDQQRMSAVMELEEKESEAPELLNTAEQESECEPVLTEKSEEVDSLVEQQIENIIEEVSAKKKPAKRAPKKKTPPSPPMEI